MIFYTGFIISLIGLIITTKKTISKKNILSPQMLLFISLLLFLYIPAITKNSEHIWDESFNLLLLFSTIGCFICIYIFPYNIIEKKPCRYTINVKIFKFFAYAYALLLVYQIINTIRIYGSIGAVFSANRVSGYLGENLTGGNATSWIYISMFKIFYYYYINYLFDNKKIMNGLALCLLPMIHHRFTAVTRYDFIAMSGALVLFLIDNRLYIKNAFMETYAAEGKKKIHFFRMFIVGFILAYAALVYMEIANLTRHGIAVAGQLNLSVGSVFNYILSNDSKYYDYLYSLYNSFQNGIANLDWGKSYFLYPIINFIPRAIWANKPLTSFSSRMTDAVYWGYFSGQSVVTFTIFGEGYGQFGLIGCVLCSIIFLAARWKNIRQCKKIEYNRLYLLMMIFSMFTYMRSEAPIFYVILDGFWLWIIRRTCTIRTQEEV